MGYLRDVYNGYTPEQRRNIAICELPWTRSRRAILS